MAFSDLWPLGLGIIIPLPIFLAVGVIYLFKAREDRLREAPLSNRLLRPAGYSLSQQLEDKFFDLATALAVLPIGVFGVPIVVLVQAYFKGAEVSETSWYMAGTASFLIGCFSIKRLLSLLSQIKRLKLGYHCELEVSQHLDRAVRPEDRNYQIYHDIPFEGFNIDHLAVTTRGVFVVETKGRSKPITESGKNWQVTLKDNALHFPKHKETAPIEQAKRNSLSVKQWLESSTGRSVPCAAILVLPGWYINYRQRMADLHVVNSKSLVTQFSRFSAGEISPEQFQAICYQVEQRVRDIEVGKTKKASFATA